MRPLAQIRLIHISDVHFGSKHICAPPDPTGSSAGIAPLAQQIERDLASAEWGDSLWATPKEKRPDTPLFLSLTGDFTQKCASDEFEKAYEFVTHLTHAHLLDSVVGKDKLFIIPGNHDVAFNEKAIDKRFKAYSVFYNRIFDGAREAIPQDKAQDFTQVHVRSEHKTVIAEINSCLYVEKDTADESRGQVDLAAIARLRAQLDSIREETADFIKIALIHHHPILIPSLVEPGHGYDAVLNSGSLLRLLQDFGFQLVLHGHKHLPQVFSFDPESAWSLAERLPQVIVSGGSAGSAELPPGTNSMNSYNVITVKWDAKAQHGRLQIVTRGLTRVGADGALDPDEWQWKTLRVSDRKIGPFRPLPEPRAVNRAPAPRKTDEDQQRRWNYYNDLRFNMPVAEIIPSLMPGQAYEARVWLEPHSKEHKESPVKVTWSAGTRFERKWCGLEASPHFCAYFHYWGPMLVQAELEFKDGKKAVGYVYARFPGPT